MNVVLGALLLASMMWAVWESELMIDAKKRAEKDEEKRNEN